MPNSNKPRRLVSQYTHVTGRLRQDEFKVNLGFIVNLASNRLDTKS